MSKQNDSDPLPFQQFDRAAKVIAARLAPRIEVSYQHALGSLQEFWELNGEPRSIEALIVSGKDAVVLSREEVIRRFGIASSKARVDPDDLVTLGLLEKKTGDEYRVRGMSRYFEPIRERLRGKENSSAGGKKSAESRKAKSGSAIPPNASNGEGRPKKTRKKAGPVQPDLPGTPPAPPPPPRQRSRQEEAYDDYQTDRRTVLVDELGVEFVADDPAAPTFINVSLAPILKAVEPLNIGDKTGWERLTELWWDDAWAAKCIPPFPFNAFVSGKVYPQLLKKLTEQTK